MRRMTFCTPRAAVLYDRTQRSSFTSQRNKFHWRTIYVPFTVVLHDGSRVFRRSSVTLVDRTT